MHSKANTDVPSFGGDHTVQGPLVSVGIPTFNRASLLDQRLRNVLSQTYRNLEVIISDNASPDLDVQAVIQKWAVLDPRVRTYRQNSNIGPHNNFVFVMDEATGPFFVWAADDDDWDEEFIACAVAGIGQAQLFMPRMATHFMTTGLIQEVQAPKLSPKQSKFENAVRFLTNMQPGILYGLHDLDSIKLLMPNKTFDLADALIVYEVILNRGVQTSDGAQYRAGVPDDVYKVKVSGRLGSIDKISYRSFFIGCVRATFLSRGVSSFDKFRLLPMIVNSTISVARHLTIAYPELARPQHVFLCRIIAGVEAIKGWARGMLRRT